MELSTVWFLLIAVLWTGYLVLEGFDFGVGMLLPVLGRTDTQRRVLINSIGPVWDGNEVWLLTAGGATFAAFPEWYATMFSGFYLPLLLILLALIVRVVAFEWRSKIDDDRWRRRADRALIFGSMYPDVMPGLDPANSLTVQNASSSQYTLGIMTWVAALLIPLVLVYQGWTYWVFRKRISAEQIPAHTGLTFSG